MAVGCQQLAYGAQCGSCTWTEGCGCAPCGPQHPAWDCLAVVLCSWQAAQIPCDAGSINEMIKLMDANKDGSIGWGEFESFMMQVIRSVRFGPAWGWDMLRLHMVCISCGSWSGPGFTKVAGKT